MRIFFIDLLLELLRRKHRAIEENNTQQLAQTCRSLADWYQENQKYDDALQHYKEGATAYRSLGMRMETCRAHRMIGEMYMLMENFDEALKYGLKYLSMLNKHRAFLRHIS